MKRPNVFLLFLLLPVLLAPACGDNPTDAVDTPGSSAVGRIDPGGVGDVLLGTVSAGPAHGRIEVWAGNLSVQSGGVSFDAVMRNVSRTDIVAPLYFVITAIRPDVVHASNPDQMTSEGPLYDFSDDVGTDGILAAGEASAPVAMTFDWPEPVAFSIAFRVQAGDSISDGFVSGIVFNDRNRNGIYEPNVEPGIPELVVEMRPSARDILYRTRTNRVGAYIFEGLTPDVYTVTALAGPNMRPTTPNPLIVTLVRRADGTVTGLEGVNFGFEVMDPPAPLPIWGPVPVGPAVPGGTRLDSTFVVPDFFAAVDLYLTVTPPPILGPFPLHISEAMVDINNRIVWSFSCPADSTCMPAERVLLDPTWVGRENYIGITVLGDERSFLNFSIEAVTRLPGRD